MKKRLAITINVHGSGPEEMSVPNKDLFGRFAYGRYTYHLGLTRVMDLLKEHGIPATFFWPLFEAVRCSEGLERCLRDGHEIANGGLKFEDHEKLGDREADVLESAHVGLTKLCGIAPVGFRAPAWLMSPKTIELLCTLGYRYDSSCLDDDAPYSLAKDGGPGMFELPWNETLCDSTHFDRRITQARAEAMMAEELEALLAVEGYAMITLHPRADYGVGRLARIDMVSRLLERAHTQLNVQFFRCSELVTLVADRS
jgi:peptidoglycan-N-acetylglucosamine deacetylase